MPYKATLNKSLIVSTGSKQYQFGGSHQYKEILENDIEVDRGDASDN